MPFAFSFFFQDTPSIDLQLNSGRRTTLIKLSLKRKSNIQFDFKNCPFLCDSTASLKTLKSLELSWNKQIEHS